MLTRKQSILSVGGKGAEDAIASPEWRQPAEPLVARRAPRIARPRHSIAAKLHLNSRPGNLAQERERAQEVITTAKEIVSATFAQARFGRRINVSDLEPVVAAVTASVARHPTALQTMVRLKDGRDYAYLHAVAVCGLMVGLANALKLDPSLTHEIGLAGLLHDLGETQLPASLLDKPERLTDEEYHSMQSHTRDGYDLLTSAGIDSSIALDVCLHHHERADGSGYPTGMSAPTLSIYARMAAVCDVYDALTSDRMHRETWSPGAALEWISDADGEFDPRVVRAFRSMIGVFPLGSLVRLESERLAIVVNEPMESPFSPDVCIFLCARTGSELEPKRQGTRHDPILGLESNASWKVANWTARRADMLHVFGAP